MKSLAWLFVKSPVCGWVWLFLAINLFTTSAGSVNPGARWTMMVAMIEDHSFRIDKYYGHTIDWSRTPDGHYYSNKAPGPSMLGFPIFWAMDKLDAGNLPARADRDFHRAHQMDDTLHTLSMLTQAIPLAIITLLLFNELQKLRVPRAGLHLGAIALLFGNTASLFVNTYFGHTMAAIFVLLMVFAIHKRSSIQIGLYFGLSVMCDYADMLLILPLIIALWMTKQITWKRLLLAGLGGAVPGGLFAYYHAVCFGSPFTLSTKYVNPMFVDVKVPSVWGVLRIIPDFSVMKRLLYFPERGLAFTQPWVLTCVALALIVAWMRHPDAVQKKALNWISTFAIVGLTVFLWMNSCWGGWHGGSTCGPRYLGSILPVFGLIVPLLYGQLSPFFRQLIFVTLAPGLLLFVLVLTCSYVLAPELPLLQYYFGMTFQSDVGNHLFRLFLILLGGTWVGYRAYLDIVKDRLEGTPHESSLAEAR